MNNTGTIFESLGRRPKLFMAQFPAMVLFLSGTIQAGEKEDSPVSSGPSNSFGAMVFDTRERVDVAAIEETFLRRVETKQDTRCLESGSPELRKLAYLEFRKFVFSKSYIQDQEIKAEDSLLFAGFLEVALSKNGEQIFQIKSETLNRRLVPFPKASVHDNNVQQFFSRLSEERGKELLNDSFAAFGMLDVQRPHVKIETLSAIKSFQIKAKIEPMAVLKECRLNLFSNESSLYLVDEISEMSKCFIEKDSRCFASWMSLCPALQVTHFLENQEQFLKQTLPKKAAPLCLAAFEEVVRDTLKKDPPSQAPSIKVSNKQ